MNVPEPIEEFTFETMKTEIELIMRDGVAEERAGLSNDLGFGGTNAVLVFERSEE